MSWNRIVPPWLDAVDLTPRVNAVQTRANTANTKIDNDLTPKINSITELSDITRDSVVLGTGTSVVSGTVGSVANVEIEGRTLTSLANSNLEAGKQYVLADKKTRVVVDGVTQAGVAKFTKGTTTVSTANFVNKVAGSTVANPHSYKVETFVGLRTPSQITYEPNTTEYGKINTLNSTISTTVTVTNTYQSQHLFSFDIIQEVERKLGTIPRSTLSEKVQWIKDNVDTMSFNWHGTGSGTGGNKATIHVWNGAWVSVSTHSSSAIGKLSINLVNSNSPIQYMTDGFMHFLAYAEPSDGVTPSSVSTDYVDLVITLKSTAQLNTRATIIRIENFEGKVAGSVVENPHTAKYQQGASLISPTGVWTESNGSGALGYDRLRAIDGQTYTQGFINNEFIAQQLFSFNLIEAVERNIGRIPRSSVTDKVQWLKDNLSKLTGNWYGFGSGVGGFSYIIKIWDNIGAGWSWGTNHINNVVSKITHNYGGIGFQIDASGFVHYIAYTLPSDGITASTIHTDYIELEIELKPTADFSRPKVPLYEVTADSYSKILVDWNADAVISRYPTVESTQHIQGLGIVSEGENLIPPFTEWTYINPNAKIISPYELEINSTTLGNYSYLNLNVKPNTTFNIAVFGNVDFAVYRSDGISTLASILSYRSATTASFTTDSVTTNIRIFIQNQTATGKFVTTNPMLTLGSTAKPFVPRDPSYLYADVKLGAIGTVSDRLYEQDGQKMVRKAVEKDVVLDGSLAWVFSLDFVKYKRFGIGSLVPLITKESESVSTDDLGKRVRWSSTAGGMMEEDFHINAPRDYSITVPDIRSGFGETYTPSSAEIKAYFYGWKMNNGTFGTNYESTGTKTWVPIGDTSNARAVTTCPTSASPTQLDGTIQPYKLSYVLTTPQVVNVSDKVEGSLKVNGSTQVGIESGLVVREKVVPTLNSGFYQINYNAVPSSVFKHKVGKVLSVYRNGQLETRYTISLSGGYGNQRILIPQSDFDPTAEYTVTYIALDKHLLTNNPMNVKLSYAKNIRTSVNDLLRKSEDSSASISVQSKLLVDILARLKAGGI